LEDLIESVEVVVVAAAAGDFVEIEGVKTM
jgi:hypothetical protein